MTDGPATMVEEAIDSLNTDAGISSVRSHGGVACGSAVDSPRLHRKLPAFDALLLTLSCLSPVFSVYGPGSDVLQHAGTGAAALFLIGIGAAAIWGMVYAELGSAYPCAGGDYVGVGSILGPAAGFACLALWAVVVLPLNAFLAKMVATYLAEVLPLARPAAVTFIAMALAACVALLAVRASAMLTGVFLAIELLAVLALVVAGLWHPGGDLLAMLAHPRIPDAHGRWVPVATAAMAMGAVNAAFAAAGGNQAIAFGEELIDPHRNMGRVILIACLIGAVAIALPVVAAAWSASGQPDIFRSAAPLSTFVTSVAGPLAGKALSAAVALAVFNALIAQLLFASRLFFSFARDGVFPARVNAALAKVHPSSGAPRIATLAVTVVSALCCLIAAHILLVFLSGMVVYALALVSIAVLVGRVRGQTGGAGFWRSPWYPLVPLLGLALAFAFAAADWMDPDAGRPSLLALGVLLFAAVLWYHFVLARRPGGWAPRVHRPTAKEK
ncbi:MAG TPA: APC family permease [Steroidobacteraceae bacterium]|nr:APC family permease [Steroidobacteraceae bacterium]